MSTGKFALTLFDGERVIRKIQTAFEILHGWQSRVGHARDVDSHIAAPGQDWFADRSANVDIKRSIPVEFFDRGNKLSQKVYRTAWQTQLRVHRRVVGQFSLLCDFRNVEWEICRQFGRLNFR